MKLLLVLLSTICLCLAMRQQSVGISGRLRCGDKPAVGVKVKLWDEDDGMDPDDLLDEGYTDANGRFSLKKGFRSELNLHVFKFEGSTRELTNIDPVFKVYHDCDDGLKPGQRKVKFRIPDSYISSGGLPRRIFDFGEVNLETIFAKEERDLL